MVTLTQLPPVFTSRGYDEVPQHPLERLYPLRIDIQLRRGTFAHWSTSANVSAEDLCDNGFYYTGINDRVQCTFCGGVLSGWSKGDDIPHEHARHFGQCELVILKQRLMQVPTKNPNTKQNQVNKTNVKPYNSHYSKYDDRVRSFKQLKTMKQSPQSLAAIGLYYKGTEDTCQCYMCGGILSGWEEDDIPKDEHKRWFPRCPLNN